MRKLIKSNPFLFNLWFQLYRKNRGVRINYFTQKTKFLLDGYPRSGNTFSANLIKHLFEKDAFVHHLHAIAPIKIALRKNISVFILIREPKEAITSNYLKSFALKNKAISKEINKDLLIELTLDYLSYYEFVKSKRSEIQIVNFKNLISNPENFVSSIKRLVYNNDWEISPLQIEDAIKAYKGATDTYGSSKPNPEKEKLKNILKEELIKTPEYKRVEQLYKTLI